MTILIIRFLNILMAGLIAGILFEIWIGYNPQSLSAPTYVEHQQSVIKSLNGYYGQSLPPFHCKVYHSLLPVVADVI